MATIRIHDEKNTIIEHQEEVARFLDEQEVIYEQWNIEKLPSELSEKYDLTEDEKERILAAFDTEIQDISARRGYQSQDVISLSDTTPNLDELLKISKENITTRMMKSALSSADTASSSFKAKTAHFSTSV